MNYIVLDLEWDSVYSVKHHRFLNQIIQIGAIKLDENLNTVSTFSEIIKPVLSKKLRSRIKTLTNISNDDVKAGQPFSKVVKDFEEWIGEDDAFPVKGYSINSTLFSVSDCQSIIKKAVVERLKTKYAIPWFEETGALYQIQFSIMKNQVTLYIDTSGKGLHKRGYRPETVAAPLRETLAAAVAIAAPSAPRRGNPKLPKIRR